MPKQSGFESFLSKSSLKNVASLCYVSQPTRPPKMPMTEQPWLVWLGGSRRTVDALIDCKDAIFVKYVLFLVCDVFRLATNASPI